MNQSTIAVTLVRLFAVGLIVYAFQNAGMAIFFIAGGDTSLSDIYIFFTAIAVPAIGAGFLWLTPDKVVGAGAVIEAKKDEQTFDAQKSFSVGVALIGLYVAVTAIAAILDWFIRHREQMRLMEGTFYTSSVSYAALYSDIFLVIVGLLLFLGSSGVTHVFLSLKTYGTEVADSPDTGFNRPPESSGPDKPDKPSSDAE